MTSSWKSKSLRVERLESRELMASYVGIVEAAELEDMNLLSEKMAGKGGENWAKPIRMEVDIDSVRPPISPHLIPREMKGSTPYTSLIERNNISTEWMIHVPIVRQVYVVVAVRPYGSGDSGQSTVPNDSGSSKLIPGNGSNIIDDRMGAVGEGEGPERVMDAPPKGSSNSLPTVNREVPQPNSRRPDVMFGGDASTNVAVEEFEKDSEGSSNVRWNSTQETATEARSERQIREDQYFLVLGEAMKSENQEVTLDDAYLDLFVFSSDRSRDFLFEDRLRNRLEPNAEITWDYLVATAYGDEITSEEATTVKHNSLFDVYDASRNETMIVETLRYDASKFLKDVTERSDEGTDEKSSLTDSRYWALGLAIASAWLRMQQRKSRSSKWLLGFKSFARIPQYFKKDSDRR